MLSWTQCEQTQRRASERANHECVCVHRIRLTKETLARLLFLLRLLSPSTFFFIFFPFFFFFLFSPRLHSSLSVCVCVCVCAPKIRSANYNERWCMLTSSLALAHAKPALSLVRRRAHTTHTHKERCVVRLTFGRAHSLTLFPPLLLLLLDSYGQAAVGAGKRTRAHTHTSRAEQSR